MREKFGKLYTTIESGNPGKNIKAALADENEYRIPVKFVEWIPEYGPSGVPLNDKKYKIEIDENNEYFKNLYVGQELYFSYKKKGEILDPPGTYNYSPTYNLEHNENLINMSRDPIVKVLKVYIENETNKKYVILLSQVPLYAIDDYGSELVLNISKRDSVFMNKIFPTELYVSNLEINEGIASIDFYFTDVTQNALKYTIAYRDMLNDGNNEWQYITVYDSPYKFNNLFPNRTYEVRIMSFFNDGSNSEFSPRFSFKTT